MGRLHHNLLGVRWTLILLLLWMFTYDPFIDATSVNYNGYKSNGMNVKWAWQPNTTAGYFWFKQCPYGFEIPDDPADPRNIFGPNNSTCAISCRSPQWTTHEWGAFSIINIALSSLGLFLALFSIVTRLMHPKYCMQTVVFIFIISSAVFSLTTLIVELLPRSTSQCSSNTVPLGSQDGPNACAAQGLIMLYTMLVGCMSWSIELVNLTTKMWFKVPEISSSHATVNVMLALGVPLIPTFFAGGAKEFGFSGLFPFCQSTHGDFRSLHFGSGRTMLWLYILAPVCLFVGVCALGPVMYAVGNTVKESYRIESDKSMLSSRSLRHRSSKHLQTASQTPSVISAAAGPATPVPNSVPGSSKSRFTIDADEQPKGFLCVVWAKLELISSPIQHALPFFVLWGTLFAVRLYADAHADSFNQQFADWTDCMFTNSYGNFSDWTKNSTFVPNCEDTCGIRPAKQFHFALMAWTTAIVSGQSILVVMVHPPVAKLVDLWDLLTYRIYVYRMSFHSMSHTHSPVRVPKKHGRGVRAGPYNKPNPNNGAPNQPYVPARGNQGEGLSLALFTARPESAYVDGNDGAVQSPPQDATYPTNNLTASNTNALTSAQGAGNNNTVTNDGANASTPGGTNNNNVSNASNVSNTHNSGKANNNSNTNSNANNNNNSSAPVSVGSNAGRVYPEPVPTSAASAALAIANASKKSIMSFSFKLAAAILPLDVPQNSNSDVNNNNNIGSVADSHSHMIRMMSNESGPGSNQFTNNQNTMNSVVSGFRRQGSNEMPPRPEHFQHGIITAHNMYALNANQSPAQGNSANVSRSMSAVSATAPVLRDPDDLGAGGNLNNTTISINSNTSSIRTNATGYMRHNSLTVHSSFNTNANASFNNMTNVTSGAPSSSGIIQTVKRRFSDTRFNTAASSHNLNAFPSPAGNMLENSIPGNPSMYRRMDSMEAVNANINVNILSSTPSYSSLYAAGAAAGSAPVSVSLTIGGGTAAPAKTSGKQQQAQSADGIAGGATNASNMSSYLQSMGIRKPKLINLSQKQRQKEERVHSEFEMHNEDDSNIDHATSHSLERSEARHSDTSDTNNKEAVSTNGTNVAADMTDNDVGDYVDTFEYHDTSDLDLMQTVVPTTPGAGDFPSSRYYNSKNSSTRSSAVNSSTPNTYRDYGPAAQPSSKSSSGHMNTSRSAINISTNSNGLSINHDRSTRDTNDVENQMGSPY
jgi:hypothetical protein